MAQTEMRSKFEEGIRQLLVNKRCDNKAYLNNDEYRIKLGEVKAAQKALATKGVEKNVKHYRLVRKYDIETIDGRERLVKVDKELGNVLLYVTNEELFDILHEIHCAIGHGGRNRMSDELQKKYSNITKEAIMVYLRLCERCREKPYCNRRDRSATATAAQAPLKPITPHSSSTWSRARFDLIDMKSRLHDKYTYIMVYEDYATKFLMLKALKHKCPSEIASKLLDIYTTFGAPTMLHFDDDEELLKSVLGYLGTMWDGVKIVGGKGHRNMGSASKVEALLDTWMEKESDDWPTALKFIQFEKNCAFDSDIDKSPYEAMFGCTPRVGLLSTGFPQDVLENIREEDDLMAAVSKNKDDECSTSHVECDVEVLPTNETISCPVIDERTNKMPKKRKRINWSQVLEERAKNMKQSSNDQQK